MRQSVARRLGITVLMLSLLGLIFYGVMQNFRDKLVFFFSPTEILAAPHKAQKKVRLGGMVQVGSVRIVSQKEHRLRFTVTDFQESIDVVYQGFLPDLFREGQGLVAEGYFDSKHHLFVAKTILAKHDENYMPPEAQRAIDQHHGKESLQKEDGQ